MSGRHNKPTFPQINAARLKTVGGVIAGAALAGGIAASAAVTTPNTAPTAATQVASQRALADIAVLRADGPKLSRHEAHTRHQVHVRHKARAGADPDEAGKSRSRPPRSSTFAESSKSRSSKRNEAHVRRISAQKVIELAKEQVGTGENRSGASKFNKWFVQDRRALETIKRAGGNRAAYRNAAWCDMFVSWVGAKLGISGTLGLDAYTVTHAQWFKDHGRWGRQPRPGAVTFFGWNGDKIDDIEHVGFTVKDNGDGTIKTVEGNTHNTVAIRKRPKSSVVGYGYPDYKK